jgi:hypothetical protein
MIGALTVLLLAAANPALAQKSQKVKFESPDGVELHGQWYPSQNKSNPCVLVLPALGEDCSKPEYTNLATTLQKDGFSVLLFDYRGHGNSTGLVPGKQNLFWMLNQKFAKNNKNGVIDFKDYKDTAYTVFVNDIAAAKAFLDQKNDANECNSSALVLVGVDTGALLGGLWMKSECFRCRWNPPQPGIAPGFLDVMNPAIKNVMGAVFISTPSKLGQTTIPPAVLLAHPVKGQAVPTVFLYNDADPAQKKTAQDCEKNLKGANAKLFKFTGATPIKDVPKNLSGRDLLNKDTNEQVSGWIDNLVKNAKANNWAAQEFTKTVSYWTFGANPANPAGWVQATFGQGSKNFAFSTYVTALQR